jgi:hypothetical protein
VVEEIHPFFLLKISPTENCGFVPHSPLIILGDMNFGSVYASAFRQFGFGILNAILAS